MLHSLWIQHRSKANRSIDWGIDLSPSSDIFYLETCQRELWMGFCAEKDLGTYRGKEAYELFLRICTGLESELIGETEIYGQVRKAWLHFQKTISDEQTRIQYEAFFSSIFEDTKEIRTNFLHGLGNTSYGAMVRKILTPKAHETCLVIGAGELSRSVIPYLLDSQVFITNRTLEVLPELYGDLIAQFPQAASRLQVLSLPNAIKKLSFFDHIIVCTPEDRIRDEQILASHKKPIVHLGLSSSNNPMIIGLEFLFAQEKQSLELRRDIFKKAAAACDSKAKLRMLNSEATRKLRSSIPHGWEDLITFG
ncbi:MAG: hypothetical protein AB7F43_05980 [Bacteriovoracia bacterium]